MGYLLSFWHSFNHWEFRPELFFIHSTPASFWANYENYVKNKGTDRKAAERQHLGLLREAITAHPLGNLREREVWGIMEVERSGTGIIPPPTRVRS